MIIRADFHIHSGDDPYDLLPYHATEIIERAAARGLQCIAIANHLTLSWTQAQADCAATKGVLLIPAIETQLCKRDVIILNARQDAEYLRTFDDLRAYRTADMLTIAPHPFYPIDCSLRELLEPEIDAFDAIEVCSCYLPWFDRFNTTARAAAQRHGKPMVAGSDAHGLWQVGNTWTEIDTPALTPRCIFDAIRAGKATPVARPMTYRELFDFFVVGDAPRKLRNWWRKLRGTYPRRPQRDAAEA